MKQSLKFPLPKLNESVSFKEFISQNFEGSKYIAHCEKNNNLKLSKEKTTERTLILIGPEGDFSPTEIEMALQNKFKAVNLGTSRLRTETAGIIATHTINIKN